MSTRLATALIAACFALLGALPAGASAASTCAFRDTAAGAAPPATLTMAGVCLLNQERRRRGLEPVSVDARLALAAQRHADDMAARRYLGHVTPEGCSVACRALAVGFPGTVGENLAQAESAGAAMRLWLRSPAHVANIIDPGWRSLGSGVAGTGSPRWAQVFGSAPPGPGAMTGLEPQFQGPADPTGGAAPVRAPAAPVAAPPGPGPSVSASRALRVGEIRASVRGRVLTVIGRTRRASGRVRLVVRRGGRRTVGRATIGATRRFRVRARTPRAGGPMRITLRIGNERRSLVLR